MENFMGNRRILDKEKRRQKFLRKSIPGLKELRGQNSIQVPGLLESLHQVFYGTYVFATDVFEMEESEALKKYQERD